MTVPANTQPETEAGKQIPAITEMFYLHCCDVQMSSVQAAYWALWKTMGPNEKLALEA